MVDRRPPAVQKSLDRTALAVGRGLRLRRPWAPRQNDESKLTLTIHRGRGLMGWAVLEHTGVVSGILRSTKLGFVELDLGWSTPEGNDPLLALERAVAALRELRDPRVHPRGGESPEGPGAPLGGPQGGTVRP